MRIQSVEQNNSTNFQAKKFKKPRKTVQPQIDCSRILREAYSKAYGKPYSECGYWGRFKIELAEKIKDLPNKFDDFKDMMRCPLAVQILITTLIYASLPFLLIATIVKGCKSCTNTGHGDCHTEKIHHCGCQNRQNDNFNEQDEKTLNLENRFKN